jgi:hypothetical protein
MVKEVLEVPQANRVPEGHASETLLLTGGRRGVEGARIETESISCPRVVTR